MSWESQNPLQIIPTGGDDIDSGMLKVRDELARIYTILSGLFAQTGGHGHTGAINDGSQLKTAAIEDGAVTTAKLADGAVTAAKLASDVVAGVNLNYWQASKTAEVGDICYSVNMPSYAYAECTVAGITDVTEPTWGTVIDASITDGTATWKIKDVRLAYGLDTNAVATSAQAIAGADNSAVITPLQLRNGLNATGDAPVYACRAWVNFKGTLVPTIRESGNVSSITDNGPGDYTINFATPMPDQNYIHVAPSAGAASTSYNWGVMDNSSNTLMGKTVNSLRILVSNAANGTTVDAAFVYLAIFR